MSKRSLVDSIEVKTPCSADWNEMKGSDTVRFCSHCDLSLTNISTLTRKQAMKRVRQSESRICVRYVKNPVDNSPIFAERLYKITRRAGIAAGVLGASLSLGTLSYAQGSPESNKINSEAAVENVKKENPEPDKTAVISGVVTDPDGAVVPNVFVNIINEATKESTVVRTDEKGAYKFGNITAGNYKFLVSGAIGYAENEISGIPVAAGAETQQNFSLKFAETAIVNITGDPEVYSMVNGGASIIEYQSALHRAVSNDDAEEVRNLISKGESVNQKDGNYSHITPLFLAVENGNAEIAEMLLNTGAKINARDDNRQTPLMRLDEDAGAALVNLLIKHGARVNLLDREKNSALIFAARSVNAEVLRILIYHSENLNAQNGEGRTALMEAADADNAENVRVLLEAGANPNIKDNDGETALSLTTDEEIEKLLAAYGAAVETDSPQ